MKIEQLRVLNGPNYWSVARQKLIQMRLNLEEMEEFPTNKIRGFYNRLQNMLPSLHEHRCSEGVPGGFFHRVQQGTWMGHVIEHIALEIQTLAGMETGFGRTRGAGKNGVYNVVFSYIEPRAGKYAARAAFRIVEALISGEEYDVNADIERLKQIKESDAFGPSTGSLVQEAERRNIPYIRLDGGSLVQLGYGKFQKRIEATIASTTSNIAVDVAGDKEATKKLLASVQVPVPQGAIVYDEEELAEAINDIGYPVVIKPRDGNQGKGATVNINDSAEAVEALKLAQKYSKAVICEQYITGNDFRALVINYKFVAAALRKPAAVVGDGIHTIQELVDAVNKDPRRGNGHMNVMTKIIIDDASLQFLQKKGYTLDSIIPMGVECFLKTTANLSTGGTATDVTDEVHPENIRLFERIARNVGLDICGIDMMATDLSLPYHKTGASVIEVNAAPGFRMHLQPSQGKPRNVAAPVLDMLFPETQRPSIPIIAISGTNGKTTTTRLIAHICKKAGFCTGYTTTEGIYFNDNLIVAGDCSGPASAQLILKDPAVEMAVLECARGGILRAGLGFHQCDVAVITNIAEDHLGLGGIDTIEQLARVKAVVAESVSPEGYAILNADDDLVYEMRNNLSCNIALFSLDENNERVKAHVRKGGMAAVYAHPHVVLMKGSERIKIEKVKNIPITFEGKAEFNIANVLGATLAGVVSNFSIDVIRKSLLSFVPSAELTPGRMNIFNFNKFSVMVDYAHNPHGIRAVGKFISSMKACPKTGMIAGVGDRRDEDLVAIGEEAAKIFDEIIIRLDKDLRGRTAEEIVGLITSGIRKISSKKKITYKPIELEAVDTAIQQARQGSLVVLLTDNIGEVIERVKAHLQNEQPLQEQPQKGKLAPMQRFPFLRNVAAM
jgi:cyanophycin synthetase